MSPRTRKAIQLLRLTVTKAFQLLADLRIYLRYRDLTMITPLVYLMNLQVVRRFRHIPGLIVECGVWRGGMMGGIASVCGPSRSYVLFDSFEGLPPAREIDGEEATAWQSDTKNPKYYDNCRADESFAREAMKRAGSQDFQLVKGYFERTLPGYKPSDGIAILRLDGDWYESTMTCLEHLYPYVVENGVIMLDDYYTWDGCSRAVHDFLSKHSSIDRIEQCGERLCFIVKRKKSGESNLATAAPSGN